MFYSFSLSTALCFLLRRMRVFSSSSLLESAFHLYIVLMMMIVFPTKTLSMLNSFPIHMPFDCLLLFFTFFFISLCAQSFFRSCCCCRCCYCCSPLCVVSGVCLFSSITLLFVPHFFRFVFFVALSLSHHGYGKIGIALEKLRWRQWWRRCFSIHSYAQFFCLAFFVSLHVCLCYIYFVFYLRF